MTKKEMIKAIQRLEAKLYLEFKQAEQLHGLDSDIAARRSSRWASVHDAMDAMDVACDNTLPDNAKAIAILCQLVREEREAA
jgi:fructose-1,6-bisphosphatase